MQDKEKARLIAYLFRDKKRKKEKKQTDLSINLAELIRQGQFKGHSMN